MHQTRFFAFSSCQRHLPLSLSSSSSCAVTSCLSPFFPCRRLSFSNVVCPHALLSFFHLLWFLCFLFFSLGPFQCHLLLFSLHPFLFSPSSKSPWQHLAFDGDECVGYLEESCLSRLYVAAMLLVTASLPPYLAVHYLVGTDGFQILRSLPVFPSFRVSSSFTFCLQQKLPREAFSSDVLEYFSNLWVLLILVPREIDF